jgi:hypothetical protein
MTRDPNLLSASWARPKPTRLLMTRDLNLPIFGLLACGKLLMRDPDLPGFSDGATQTYRFGRAVKALRDLNLPRHAT